MSEHCSLVWKRVNIKIDLKKKLAWFGCVGLNNFHVLVDWAKCYHELKKSAIGTQE